MISLIIGRKGSGKTKRLIEAVEKAVVASNGNVVCVEQKETLQYQVSFRARLISTNHYNVSGYDAFYGFLSGICAGNHDITDILVDATLRIGTRDYDELSAFLKSVEALSKVSEKNFVFTISADEEELPKEIFDFCQKI